MGTGRSFAVLDFETTGKEFRRNHRVVEIGVVLLDENLEEEGRYSTLVNPHRDMGPIHIHHVTPRMATQAPNFEHVVTELQNLLHGRIIVGHHVAFDLQFLNEELIRANLKPVTYKNRFVCTHNLVQKYLKDNEESLELLCLELGIEHSAHEALGDCLASAEVFRLLCNSVTGLRDSLLAEKEVIEFSEIGSSKDFLSWVPRSFVRESDAGKSFMQLLFDRLPSVGVSYAERDYESLLQVAFEDFELDGGEILNLSARAAEIGLSYAQARALNARVYKNALALAESDGIITEKERSLLDRLASVLEIEKSEIASADFRNEPEVELFPGDVIVITGNMMPSRDVVTTVILNLGCVVDTDSVTKHTKLLVAHDEFVESGKAVKARKYGIPIWSAQRFYDTFGK